MLHLGAASLSKSKPILAILAMVLTLAVAFTYIAGAAWAFEATPAKANSSERLAPSPGATDDGALADGGQASAEESSATHEVLKTVVLLVLLHPFQHERLKRASCEGTQSLLLLMSM